MAKGLIVKTTGSWHTVKDGEKIINCKIKGNYRQKGLKTTNPVAVGDIVDYISKDENDIGWITTIYERENYVIRKATKLSKEAHLLAANIDQALLIVTLILPETPLEFIDRFLVTAEAYHINTKLIFNKTDLYNNEILEYLNQITHIYSSIGYNCIKTSAVTEQNINKIKKILKDKISLIAGNSGVGKTALINCINPGLNLKVDEISKYHKTGKHTTTFSEMFELDFGGYVIDSPGIKGFGIIDFKNQEKALFFPEIFKTSENCQYYNCSHTHEPKCAVKLAVEQGTIAKSRYRSYINILDDENKKYRSGY